MNQEFSTRPVTSVWRVEIHLSDTIILVLSLAQVDYFQSFAFAVVIVTLYNIPFIKNGGGYFRISQNVDEKRMA